MKHRPWLAAVSGLAVAAVAALPAGASPPPESKSLTVPAPDLSSIDGRIAQSLRGATGEIAAFVQLDAPSSIDLSEAGKSAAAIDANADAVAVLADKVLPDTANARTSTRVHRQGVTHNAVAGMIVAGDAAKIRALAAKDEVVKVSRLYPRTADNKGSNVFTGAAKAWTDTLVTGRGVRIGIIDTGIDYTHADFGGPGTAAARALAYGAKGQDPVKAGTYDATKFAGGYDFAGYNYNPALGIDPTPDPNPIDATNAQGGGHGSHVAGTTAGFGVLANGSTWRGGYRNLDTSDWKIGPGSAPHAQLYGLKVFGDLGGGTNLTLLALDWAADPNGDGDLSDHLDIVNMSLGSDNSPADDPENLFVDELASIGVLSVDSAGNGGDISDVGGSPGSSRAALTVANSVGNTVTLDALEVTAPSDLAKRYPGQNSQSYAGTADVTAPVAFVSDSFTGCSTFTAAQAATVKDKIAYLSWDDNDQTRACGSGARFNAAQAAGAVGVLLSSTRDYFEAGIAGNAGIPGAQMTGTTTTALLPAIKAGTLTVRLSKSFGNASFVSNPAIGDLLNSGSSRGVHGSLGIVKPDVAAPGTDIASVASGGGTNGWVMSGTSMSAPHVTGIAALVKQAHPRWTPAQIKAAVMNTATHDVVTDKTPTGLAYGPERVGSGRVDAAAATSEKTLAYATDDPAGVSVSFGVVPIAASPVTISKTVTLRNTALLRAATFSTSFVQSSKAGAAKVTVSPASVTVPRNGSATVTVTLTVDPATVERNIDPTQSALASPGVARDYVAEVSGRLVLTGDDNTELRVPVRAAPRLVADLTAKPVSFDFESLTAPLAIDGRATNAGGWVSQVAPFELKALSPAFDADFGEGASKSNLASADIRAVGFASTAPQLKAAGLNQANGWLGIAMAAEGEWAKVGTFMQPWVDIDVDGDGQYDLETVLTQYSDADDLAVAVTYTLRPWRVNGVLRAPGTVLATVAPNLNWGNVDTTIFDNNTLVLPIPLGSTGITAAHKPTFMVGTFSAYLGDADVVSTFTADPYNPDYWFSGAATATNGGQLVYPRPVAEGFTVNRSATAPKSGKLLVLSMHNAKPDSRWQVVDLSVKAPKAALSGTVNARCLAGKAVLAVNVKNDSPHPAKIELTTPYGAKAWNDVPAGGTVTMQFTTRAAAVPAGTVSATATVLVDGVEGSATWTAPFDAITCS